MIVSLDCETTGLQPHFHDLIQIAAIPADMDLKPDSKLLPFQALIRPRRPENIEWSDIPKKMHPLIRKAILEGLDPDTTADIFTQWFEQLRLPENKRILPLGHNWVFDKEFIIDWLGFEHYNYMFDSRYRDTMMASQLFNDIADAQVENYPFPKCNLQYLVTCLKLDFEPSLAHDAFYDAMKTLEVYRTMVHHNLIDLRHPLV